MTLIKKQLAGPVEAAQLKALGCLQIGTWFYENDQDKPYQWHPKITPITEGRAIAYTATELGIMLPLAFYTGRFMTKAVAGNEPHEIWVCYSYNTPAGSIEVAAHSEAAARAGVIVLMLSHNIINVNEVNIRLEAAFV
ncbi:hypothetical protein KHS38_11910 [Mucilaginibacter sp. Bleaf8]|uniref:hypothetical protein n=1 Tax=Mucilaginibacter sp. Bleaf8 TaxID=2834430 RepID=UPI001BCF6961|nr:hypothetical protein [Mucilaginibacter sp. Bleaf8]MBS7565111.1 hypothetical protein [Mucilaginibacter sp. Bleaf8]